MKRRPEWAGREWVPTVLFMAATIACLLALGIFLAGVVEGSTW